MKKFAKLLLCMVLGFMVGFVFVSCGAPSPSEVVTPKDDKGAKQPSVPGGLTPSDGETEQGDEESGKEEPKEEPGKSETEPGENDKLDDKESEQGSDAETDDNTDVNGDGGNENEGGSDDNNTEGGGDNNDSTDEGGNAELDSEKVAEIFEIIKDYLDYSGLLIVDREELECDVTNATVKVSLEQLADVLETVEMLLEIDPLQVPDGYAVEFSIEGDIGVFKITKI